MSYSIAVKPSRTPGKVSATSDGHRFTTTTLAAAASGHGAVGAAVAGAGGWVGWAEADWAGACLAAPGLGKAVRKKLNNLKR
jgi:hypothetical protein